MDLEGRLRTLAGYAKRGKIPFRTLLRSGEGVAYVRVGRRVTPTGGALCFQLADICGNGERAFFFRIINAMRRAAPLPIYAESIINQKLFGILLRKGWQRLPGREQDLIWFPG